MTRLAPMLYFIGLAAIGCGTLPAVVFLFGIGWKPYFILFAWLIVAGCFSWSAAQYLTTRRYW